MTVNDYINVCIQFNTDTQDWFSLDNQKFYYCAQDRKWHEDCDHHKAGFNVDWAFYKNIPSAIRAHGWVDQVIYIRQHAAQELINDLANQMKLGIEEHYDAEQWSALLSLIQ